MPSNDYCSVTTWHVPATREEVSEVIGDASGHARWWPSVYLEARGDFVGRGIWTFEVERPADDPAGPMTSVTYDWRVLAEKASSKPCRRS